MTLREYLKNEFHFDFQNMMRTEPRKECFGGQNWQSYSKNLRYISPEHTKLFIKTLFLTQLVQACIHCYFPEVYDKYYKEMPLFGNYGFGSHHIKMEKILSIPAEHGISFNDDEIKEMAQDFFDQCLVDCENLNVNYKEFLSKNHDDKEFRKARQENLGQFSTFVAEFDKLYETIS